MPIYRFLSAAVDVVITLVTALLGLRVILKLFGASESNTVVRGIYSASEPLLSPISGIFPALTLEQGFVLEFATLFALIMYAVLAHVLFTLIRAAAYAAFRRRHIPAHKPVQAT